MSPKKRKDLDEHCDSTDERRSSHHNTAKSTKEDTQAMETVGNLPLDVVWEVCTYLDFADLFALSRSCRSIRAMLTQPNASTLFIQARLRNEIAELALPMNDLSYAALLFSENCFFCEDQSGGKLDPHLRARICYSCRTKKLVYLEEAGCRMYNPYALQVTRRTGYLLKIKRANGHYKPDLDRISEDLNARFPQTTPHAPLHPVSDYIKLCDIKTDRDYACAIFSNPDNPELQMPQGAFQEWSFAQAKIKALQKQDTMILEGWLLKVADREAARKDKIRSDRFTEITRRLLLDGYSLRDFDSEKFKEHKLVKSARPLSDHMWTSKVGPQLKAFIEIMRPAPIEDVYEKEEQRPHVSNGHRYDQYEEGEQRHHVSNRHPYDEYKEEEQRHHVSNRHRYDEYEEEEQRHHVSNRHRYDEYEEEEQRYHGYKRSRYNEYDRCTSYSPSRNDVALRYYSSGSAHVYKPSWRQSRY
ncbi:F-box protein [Sporobolomyces koalae]|uniref:F-box protein n=1 Tax=Sporobolomyces koalae TaxID=500713 RepID=UPI00317FB7F4